MNLNVNILSIILSYHCLGITCAYQFSFTTPRQFKSMIVPTEPSNNIHKKLAPVKVQRKVTQDCLFFIPHQDYKMPIPITALNPRPQIVLPNPYGSLEIKHHGYIKLACPGSHFVSPFYDRLVNEITIKCLNNSLVEYGDKAYEFRKFVCHDSPKPNLVITKYRCQNSEDNRILEVAFRVKSKNIKFYKMCYNVQKKYPLFIWYQYKAPYFKRRQLYKYKPHMIPTRLFNPLDVEKLYSTRVLRNTFVELLNSTHMTDYHLRSYDDKHFVEQGFLLSNTEFNYVFQQAATYCIENTVPMWQIFRNTVWLDIENIFKRNAARGTSRRMIITGTYDVSTLPNMFEVDTPLYLDPPKNMPVPKYLWKMDYDLDNKTGIVFITLNNPYKTINNTARICESVECPGLKSHFTKYMWMFYCCDLKSFEKTYGELDPIIYEKIY